MCVVVRECVCVGACVLICVCLFVWVCACARVCVCVCVFPRLRVCDHEVFLRVLGFLRFSYSGT